MFPKVCLQVQVVDDHEEVLAEPDEVERRGSTSERAAPCKPCGYNSCPCARKRQTTCFLDRVARAVAESETCQTGSGTVTLLSESLASEFDVCAQELELLGVIFHQVLNGAMHDLKAILQGAFVLVANDGGMFYEFVKGMNGAYERISSHVSIVPQYAVRLRRLKTVLAGRCSDGDSWFQFEAGEWCPEENLCGSILHAGHYLEYKCSGLQVGPLGYSDHTDHNPLVVQFARALCPSELLGPLGFPAEPSQPSE
jgi:hypothetical protein